MIYIIMGVSGSGKSTVGRLVSQRLGWQFYDGDDFHPLENIKKMSRGIPLNDADRQRWLLDLRNLIDKIIFCQENAIVACSALKTVYRVFLQGEHQEIYWVYLKGTYEEILQRIEQREHHFMKAQMLYSQFKILEEPTSALSLNILLSPDEIVNQIINFGFFPSQT